MHPVGLLQCMVPNMQTLTPTRSRILRSDAHQVPSKGEFRPQPSSLGSRRVACPMEPNPQTICLHRHRHPGRSGHRQTVGNDGNSYTTSRKSASGNRKKKRRGCPTYYSTLSAPPLLHLTAQFYQQLDFGGEPLGAGPAVEAGRVSVRGGMIVLVGGGFIHTTSFAFFSQR